MAEEVPFLLPVIIDATKYATARVPGRFREVQWSHLPEGTTSSQSHGFQAQGRLASTLADF